MFTAARFMKTFTVWVAMVVPWSSVALSQDAATNTSRLAPEIRTPKAPPIPRINGPAIFGVRVDHPFLYRIPATGERPMTFAADGLPSGLKLDAVTGEITGALPRDGEHRVTLQAKNAKGSAEKRFRIVVGETISLTPALGWNSWNCWGPSVDADKVLKSAKAMVSSGLINHGWTYINIDEVLAVSQDALGKQARLIAESGEPFTLVRADRTNQTRRLTPIQVWARELEDGSRAVGLFNLGDSKANVTVKWSDLKIAGQQAVRDLWRQKDLGQFEGEFALPIPPHGAEMVKLRPAR